MILNESSQTTQEYYVVCNSRKDVEALYDTNGILVARYIYDSWGNTIKVLNDRNKEETSSTFIGNINPIRYRGYYYDKETGFYYLNTRYYDPEIRRFINADDITIPTLDSSSLYDKNLYAYCDNNPVNRLDETGYKWYNPFTWNWDNIGNGAELLLIGVTAIGAGIITLPFGGWISVVAGVTILAGSGSAVLGASNIGEGITNYNIVQETIFHGDKNTYNTTTNIFKYTALVGTAVCGVYGINNTTVSFNRSTPRLGNSHSALYNTKSNVLTYYGSNNQMKYSVGFFERKHQWIHWHTEMPHSKPINNFFRFLREMMKGGF